MSPAEEYIASSKKYDWMTPDIWYDFLDEIFGFTIDVCAEEWNAKCPTYFNPEMDGLKQPWIPPNDGRWWDNSPWGKQYKEDTGKTIEDWILKGIEEYTLGNEGVMLVPENPTTGWYYRNVKKVPYTYEPHGRFKFEHPLQEGNSQPTKGTLVWIFVEELEKWQIEKLNTKGRLAISVLP